MFAVLLHAFFVFLFPVQGPFLDVFDDADKIFSAFSKSIVAFYREPIGDNGLCNQSLMFQFSKSAGKDLWGDIQETMLEFRVSFRPLSFIEL